MNTMNIGKRNPIVSTVMVVVGMALLGAMLVTTVAAAPVKTKDSISDRVKNQEDICEFDGGSPTTSYGYEGGDLTSAQVKCNGGMGGQVCVNT
ncbi:MAG: hypothetical protein M3440_07565, partial [Chloroflexota bacterium]|nr:hypothetical protein [Chloroflexota bacterium]